MSNNFKLKKLYFNNNALTDKFGIKLANFLKDSKIKEFGVAWNKLTAVSGSFVFCEDEIQLIENLLNLAEEKNWRKTFTSIIG